MCLVEALWLQKRMVFLKILWWGRIVTLVDQLNLEMSNMNLLTRNTFSAWGDETGETMDTDLRLIHPIFNGRSVFQGEKRTSASVTVRVT